MTSETAYMLNGGTNNTNNHHHHHHHHHNHHGGHQLKPNEASLNSSTASSSSSPSPNSSLNNTTSSRSSTGGAGGAQTDDQQLQQLLQHDLINDPNVKYPLENSWSFWFYKGEKTKSWKDNVKFITSVDYVEDFWAYVTLKFLKRLNLFSNSHLYINDFLYYFKTSVYNHLQLVSKINVGCDYMFFKKDVPPMWEDPQNSDGGVWKLSLDKKYHNSCLDTYWLNIVSTTLF